MLSIGPGDSGSFSRRRQLRRLCPKGGGGSRVHRIAMNVLPREMSIEEIGAPCTTTGVLASARVCDAMLPFV